MYNYGYRDYKPEQARFTTVDPIRDGSNWFSYVNNDPVNWYDPLGLSAVDPKQNNNQTGGQIIEFPYISAPYFGTDWGQVFAGLAMQLGAGIIVLGTLVEDAATGGVGVADDPASFAAAASLFAAGSAIMNSGFNSTPSAPTVTTSSGGRHTPDQEALSGLAKEGKKQGGVSGNDADTLLDWDKETGMGGHDDRGTDHWVGGDHIHAGGQDHIPVK